jgi:PIN domain nuclease of toxin-antitoxin system
LAGWPSVKLLLDTHTFLWLDSEPEKLSATALAACEDPDNELYFSVVSAWEIQIKAQLGRLTLHVLLEHMVEVQQTDSGLFILPVELRHVYALDTLPQVHHDPVDRLLVAQARAERTHLMTADSQLKRYPVDILW